jgi:large subunit ribosomal protein L18
MISVNTRTKVIHPGSMIKSKRTRRSYRAVCSFKRLGKMRLRVHKTSMHTYAQLIDAAGKVLAHASTLEKGCRLKHGGNVAAATWVGQKVAERAIAAGIKDVAFDRAGFLYHGRIKALAEAAREAGLAF